VPQTRTEQQGKHFRENAPSGGEESSVQIRKGRSTNKGGTTNDARKERVENMRKVRLRNFGIVKEGRSNQEHEERAIIKNQQITYLSSEGYIRTRQGGVSDQGPKGTD